MVVPGSGPVMYSCKALYIGSATPFEETKGVEAMQYPLRQRYPLDLTQVQGVDCTLSILWDSVQVKYASSGEIIHFPLSRLTICAAVRCVLASNAATGEQSRQFVPVNEFDDDGKHPAIFSAIIRRTKGRQILECHSYICNNTRDALHLVNTTASANIALKRSRKQQRSSRYMSNGATVVNNAAYGYDVNGPTTFVSQNRSYEKQQVFTEPQPAQYVQTARDGGETIYVKSTVEASQDYISPPPVAQDVQSEASTIYIEFDKTNLVAKSPHSDTLQMKQSYERRDYEPTTHTARGYSVVEKPVYVDIPPPPPQKPYVIQAPRYMLRPQPPPPPPPRPLVYPRHPPPQMFARPVPVPMPPPMIMANPPPSAQRIYAKRVAVPHERRFFSPQPPVQLRRTQYRTRSASPHYAVSPRNIRRTDHGKYQPKWRGTSEAGDYRKSRRDQVDYSAPPRDFRQDENMFLNERAFSRRITADHRISRKSPPHNYPTAYELHDAMEESTHKSNPRYSSSSDSDNGGVRRYSKRQA